MSTTEAVGLWLVLAALIGFVIGFAYDGFRLWVLKWPTISEVIWQRLAAWRAGKGRFPVGAAVLVALWGLGAIGLALHFFF